MLGICLKVLSVLGITLLVLLAILAAGILLLLFLPFSYGVSGSKDGDGIRLKARVKWLFGILCAECRYPEPGRLKIRVFCFTLFDQGLLSEREGGAAVPEEGKKKKEKKKNKKNQKKRGKKKNRDSAPGEASSEEDAFSGEDSAVAESGAMPGGTEAEDGNETVFGKIRSKIKKLKYTFCNIYDKIKKIRENISYYAAYLQKDETRQILSDSLVLLGKILKSVRPRRIRADIRFGTGSPDTTGYLYGAYCMVSPGWGRGVCVVPDFEETVLEGEFDASGRISVWVLLVNGWKMYQLIRKLKAGRK